MRELRPATHASWQDLKPENMLLTPSGRLKLADFGLSHIAARASGALISAIQSASSADKSRPLRPSRPSRSGVRLDEVAKDPSIVGTPFYMAPETIRGKSRGLETAGDWWSFGVIAYEFLLGFPPFQVRLNPPQNAYEMT